MNRQWITVLPALLALPLVASCSWIKETEGTVDSFQASDAVAVGEPLRIEAVSGWPMGCTGSYELQASVDETEKVVSLRAIHKAREGVFDGITCTQTPGTVPLETKVTFYSPGIYQVRANRGAPKATKAVTVTEKRN
jgi:hypothetical protein